MSNMSYCRFQNTLADLRDCLDHINDHEDDMSVYEQKARKELIDVCLDIVAEYVISPELD